MYHFLNSSFWFKCFHSHLQPSGACSALSNMHGCLRSPGPPEFIFLCGGGEVNERKMIFFTLWILFSLLCFFFVNRKYFIFLHLNIKCFLTNICFVRPTFTISCFHAKSLWWGGRRLSAWIPSVLLMPLPFFDNLTLTT